MTAYTDPVAHQVDQRYLQRRLEQQAAETDQAGTDNDTTGR